MKTRIFLFLLIPVLFFSCAGNTDTMTQKKEEQSFDSTGVVKLNIKDYSVRGDVPVEYLEEHLGAAEPASLTSDYVGFDLSGDVTINNTDINVTSDSTITFNDHIHTKMMDPNGNVYYYYEKFEDDLKLAKVASKIVRKNNDVIVTGYIIKFENDMGGTFKQFKKLYSDNLKAQLENNKAEMLRQEKQGSTPKDLYENNFKVIFTRIEYTLE